MRSLHLPSLLIACACSYALAIPPAHAEPEATEAKIDSSLRQQEADDLNVSVSEDDLILAYNQAINLRDSLNILATSFPELKDRVSKIKSDYEASPLAAGAAAIEKDLTATNPARWAKDKSQPDEISLVLRKILSTPKGREEYIAGFENLLRPKYASKLEREQAEFQAILISRAPRYTSNPLLEFTDGWKRSFRSGKIPQAYGEDFSVDLPFSWVIYQTESEDTDIAIIHSRSPEGTFPFILIVDDASSTDLIPATYFADQAARKQDTSSFGENILSYQPVTLAGQAAGRWISDMDDLGDGTGEKALSIAYMLLHGKHTITMSILLPTIPGISLEDCQKKYQPLFEAIAATLQLHEQGK